MHLLKKLYINVYKFIVRCIYNFLSFFRKHDSNKVIIALYRTKELEGNLEYIYEELIKQMPNAKIHLVVGENKMNLRLFKEIVRLSNARYLIVDDYYLPIYLVHPRIDLKVIQLWHAAGAFKKFGHSTVGTKFGPTKDYIKMVPIHSNYTHVYVTSKHIVPFYAEAFNMSQNRIFPLGIPRVDLFNNKDKSEEVVEYMYRDFSFLKEENVNILIAPTYRAKGTQSESKDELTNTIIKISKLINNNIYIIFKAHPYMDKKELGKLKECPNIIIASEYSINEWMLVSDAFITDYSSSIFEFALLKRPMAHYIPDIKEYLHNRGFYQDIHKISDGEVLLSSNELIQWINSIEKYDFFDSTRMIKYNFDYTEDVSKRIVTHFISK
ncbi:CDP-glycerol glycerophosphotransferase family protein [Oceanobacillus bengalensis]|uniref:Ribitolphosphotransferase n=1 Tax=Oceanobacillus bengalensis TaxID=1435466 RepID=A0A494Z0C1_9BACI|nr:CDP-glycerol glycerophosphotransferase family protein [Oceanobacillus bengalensis]RKQ15725.1 ribitolphosphotransferase [Oceanobacillus bengalensis]